MEDRRLRNWIHDVSLSLRIAPVGNWAALFASISASLLFILSAWKNSNFKDFSIALTLVIILARRKYVGIKFVTIVLMMTWESPKTLTSLNPNSLSSLIPWKRANASACMLEEWPSPQANMWIGVSSIFIMSPPAPVIRGFPLVAPSKKREGIVCLEIQDWKSSSFLWFAILWEEWGW